MQKQQSYKTRGMQRDLSFSAFNPEFAYENMNMRLITQDENTLLSLVNEQGNKMVETIEGLPLNHLEGIPIGTQVINDELIIFTAKRTSSEDDFIYKIWLDEDNNFLWKSFIQR